MRDYVFKCVVIIEIVTYTTQIYRYQIMIVFYKAVTVYNHLIQKVILHDGKNEVCIVGQHSPNAEISQKIGNVHPLLFLCWATVSDAGPT